MNNHTRRIRSTLYGDQPLSETELDLIHTESIQRLYDLHQLGQTDRVYVDASHTRFSHVLGVMHEASKLLKAIVKNLKRQEALKLEYTGCSGAPPTRGAIAKHVLKREPAVRLMALLHDLTHAPFGHTLEDEIELCSEKHDEPERQAKAFLRLLCEWIANLWDEVDKTDCDKEQLDVRMKQFDWFRYEGRYQDDLSEKPEFIDTIRDTAVTLCSKELSINRSPRSITPEQIQETLKNLRFAFRALFYLEAGHKPKLNEKTLPKSEYPLDKLLEDVLKDNRMQVKLTHEDEFVPKRDAYALDIIGNTICADLLDYAKRDSHNSGLRLNFDDDRIVENFTLVSYRWDEAKEKKHPFNGTSIRTAVSLFTNKFRPDAVGELIGLLQTRYYVYERMLYHPTKCVAGATLGSALQRMGWKTLPNYLRSFGDATFIEELQQAGLVAKQLLADYHDSTEYYSTDVAKSISTRLEALSIKGITVSKTTQQLLDDLIPNQIGIERLYICLERLSETKDFSRLIQTTSRVDDVDKSAKRVGFSSQTIKELINEYRRAGAGSSVNPEVVEWTISLLFPTVEQQLESLKAGLRLLHMLTSRRYPQRVFALLGKTHEASDVSNVSFSSSEIAERFRDPLTRHVAERAIERRCGMDSGSVVIHCPHENGPVKLAKVLLTHGKHTNPPKMLKDLNKLSGLSDGMFDAHKGMVDMQEDMYQSTWRLTVSVARPNDKNWEEISKKIGTILYDILAGPDADGSRWFPNNRMMVDELRIADERCVRNSNTADQLADPISQLTSRYDSRAVLAVMEELSEVKGIGEFLANESLSFAAESRDEKDEDRVEILRNRLRGLLRPPEQSELSL